MCSSSINTKQYSEGNFGIYIRMVATATTAKIYNSLVLNRILLEIEKILRKNQNNFPSNLSQLHRF